jgi:hypothetical protein
MARTKTVEARDIPFCTRVLGKQGEGRVALPCLALSSLLWTSNKKNDAESQYGLSCQQRLEPLEADVKSHQNINAPLFQSARLRFHIDDGVGTWDISCTRLKNKYYLTDRLEWPEELQQKGNKLHNLWVDR